ncbi:sensor histidine kinase [Pyxidicoccus sp. MSG2]|uniref:sensor histidine kinase n=1 Tax=Pyxidicoccus sp. MSG2 TaxID=2996790 RepID=UPI00226FB996|nr:sensor histidine kinase [Pyxidicoccus sp. MSG2]MCY1021299.1 sensor histidine kinase [Pyxidicoccus sp. MSG2]
MENASPRAWRRWAWLASVWTVPATLAAVETYFFSRLGPQPLPLWRAFASQLPAWYVWLPATPALVHLSRRLRLGLPLKARAVGGHLAACLGVGGLFALVYTLCHVAFMPAMANLPPLPLVVLRYWLGWMPMMAMTYAAVVGVAYAVDSQRRARENERQAAALSVQLAEARLQALQTQLHPHFLFNTLNAIVVLVREQETDTAARMLVLLSDILRRLLQQGATQEVPLRDEVAVLSRYLEIQQLRFQDRLRVDWDVDSGVLDARVPNLVLQPLVENAIRHGVSMRSAAGVLRIRARREGDVLELAVMDDGPGLPAGFELERSPGIGLSNTRARLAQLYGDAGRVSVASVAGGIGTVATVLLPLREDSTASAEKHAHG